MYLRLENYFNLWTNFPIPHISTYPVLRISTISHNFLLENDPIYIFGLNFTTLCSTFLEFYEILEITKLHTKSTEKTVLAYLVIHLQINHFNLNYQISYWNFTQVATLSATKNSIAVHKFIP